MKKVIIYILGFLLLCFLIPMFFTKPFSLKDASSENITQSEDEKSEEVNSSISSYDYKEYNKIKVLHITTNEIEEIDLDEYLYGVVSAEMPANFELEALKAQAVVARTYTIYKITTNNEKHPGAHICDDSTCCQAWISKEDRLIRWEEQVRQENWEKIVTAVDTTKGKIITYEGNPINAFFHASSGGITEVPINVWGGSGYPYLQVVQTAGEEGYTQYASEVMLEKAQLVEQIKQRYSDIEVNWEEEFPIEITEYTESGRVKTIKIGNKNLSGVEARSIFSLKSTNFTVVIGETNVSFSVIGYGHGVGMSQTGADALAKQGKTYEDIIYHYYKEVDIKDL